MKRRVAFKAVDGNARSVVAAAALPLDLCDTQFSMASWERHGMASSKTPRTSNISRQSPRSFTKEAATQQKPPKPTYKKRQMLPSQVPTMRNPKRSRNSTGSLLSSPALRILPSPRLDKSQNFPLTPGNRSATPDPPLKPTKGHLTISSTEIVTRNNEKDILDGQEHEKRQSSHRTDDLQASIHTHEELQTNVLSRQNQIESDEDMDCGSSVDSCFTSSSSATASASSSFSLENDSKTPPHRRPSTITEEIPQRVSIPHKPLESTSNPSNTGNAQRYHQISMSAPDVKFTDVLKGIEDTAIDNENVFQMMMTSATTRAPTKRSPGDDSILKVTIGDEHFTPHKLDDDSDITFLSLDEQNSPLGRNEQRTAKDIRKKMVQKFTERSLDFNAISSTKTQKAKYRPGSIPFHPIQQHQSHQGDEVLDVDIPDDGSITAWSIAGCITSPFEFEIDGTRYIHEPLPHGYKVKVSRTHKRPIYLHPERAPSWYCPVVLKGSSAYRKMSIAELKSRKPDDAPCRAGSSVFENSTRQTPSSPPSPRSSPWDAPIYNRCAGAMSTAAPFAATRPTEAYTVAAGFQNILPADKKSPSCSESAISLVVPHQYVPLLEGPEIIDNSRLPILSHDGKNRRTPESMSELVNRYKQHNRELPVHQGGYDCDMSESLQSCKSSSSMDSWLQDSGKQNIAGPTKSNEALLDAGIGSRIPLSPVNETTSNSDLASGPMDDGAQKVDCRGREGGHDEGEDFVSDGTSGTAYTATRGTTVQVKKDQLLPSDDSMISEMVSMKSQRRETESDPTMESSKTSSTFSSRTCKSSMQSSLPPESAVTYEDFTSLRHGSRRSNRDRSVLLPSTQDVHHSLPVLDDEWSPRARQQNSMMVLTIGDLESKENPLDVSALTSLCDTEALNSNYSNEMKAQDIIVRADLNSRGKEKLESYGHVRWKSPNCSGISRASDEDSPDMDGNGGLVRMNGREATTVLRNAHDQVRREWNVSAEDKMSRLEHFSSPKRLGGASTYSNRTSNSVPPEAPEVDQAGVSSQGRTTEDVEDDDSDGECGHNINAAQEESAVQAALTLAEISLSAESKKAPGYEKHILETLVHNIDNEKGSYQERQTLLQVTNFDDSNCEIGMVKVTGSKSAHITTTKEKTSSIVQDLFGAQPVARKAVDRDDNSASIQNQAATDANEFSEPFDLSNTRQDDIARAYDDHESEEESPVNFGNHYHDDSNQFVGGSPTSFQSPTIGQTEIYGVRHLGETNRRKVSNSYDDQSTDLSSRDSKNYPSTKNLPGNRQDGYLSSQSQVHNDKSLDSASHTTITNTPFARDNRQDVLRESLSARGKKVSIESISARANSRRRHSWRALNPPHPICSLQRLEEIQRRIWGCRTTRAKGGKGTVFKTPIRTKRKDNRHS
jgi:hypothetical protein